jgi:hypothetical protein
VAEPIDDRVILRHCGVDAGKAMVTLGEISDARRKEWGTYWPV